MWLRAATFSSEFNKFFAEFLKNCKQRLAGACVRRPPFRRGIWSKPFRFSIVLFTNGTARQSLAGEVAVVLIYLEFIKG
jgi:hypothetical protein